MDSGQRPFSFKNKPLKTLYIARHAKSSWDDLNVSDHDRKLLPVGIKRTEIMAGWLKKQKTLPDRIISSTATRAYETARLLANGIGFPEDKIEKNSTLYGADTDDVMEILYALPKEVEKVMVVGHNPDFTELANLFLDSGRRIDNLPTSGVVAVHFKAKKWNEIDGAKARVAFLMTPRMVRELN